MNLRNLCITIITLILTSQVLSANTTDSLSLNLDDICNGIRYRAELLKSTHVSFTSKLYHNFENNNYKFQGDVDKLEGITLFERKECDLFHLEGKIKIYESYCTSDTGPALEKQFAWDNQKYLALFKHKDKPLGTIQAKKGPHIRLGCWLTPIELEVFDFKKTLVELLDEVDWEISGIEMVRSYEAYRLDSIDLHDGETTLSVWIDPLCDFAPVKMELVFNIPNKKPIIYKMYDIDLKQIDNVWMISDAKYSMSNFNNNDPKPDYCGRYILGKFEAGVDIPAETFSIEFPQRTVVQNDILNISYIVGESELKKIENVMETDSIKSSYYLWISIILILFISLTTFAIIRKKRYS